MATIKGQIVRHVVLPGFWPRLHALFTSGFVHIAYLIAVIYQNVRLLPQGHPYLNPQNMGKYGIRHVIAEASNNLVFSKKNIDQIFVFLIILAGLVLLLTQFILLIFALVSQPATAAAWTNWFGSTKAGPSQDIAFIILDRVFGLHDFYNSCVSDPLKQCKDIRGNIIPIPTIYPFPIHMALRELLKFYSWGIAIIGGFVLIYFVITIVGETAATGTPFGQRYNKAWVPVRIILFFALLIPLNFSNKNDGLNGAQMITFYAARWGSNLASNAWVRFNTVLTGSYLGSVDTLIATPNPPELGSLNQFMFVAMMCKISEAALHNREIRGYIVRERVTKTNYVDINTTNYTAARAFARNGSLIIRFGELDPGIQGGNPDPTEYGSYKGYVNPLCGQITIQPGDAMEPGALGIQEDYYDMLVYMWTDIDTKDYAECVLRRTLPVDPDKGPAKCDWPDRAYVDLQQSYYSDWIRDSIQVRIDQQKAAGNFSVPPGLLEKGWAGAAIWYNRIAKMNGAITTAIMNIPRPQQYPYVMEEIVNQRRANDSDVSGPDRYDPLLSDGRLVDFSREGDQYMAAALYAGFKFWEEDGALETEQNRLTGNIVIDTINMLLGTSGLFEMRKNPTIHPLAQLSSLGNGLIQAAVRNALFAAGGAVGSSLDDLFTPFVGQLADTAGGFFKTLVQTTLVMGIMLYYVLPFLPFIYFLFAVSGWVKSIFEAMVAMPLWALAHIRLDGEGIPGAGATNGYFLLLEIVLRPILIVFGLLASISIFSALVMGLNQIFDLVVANLGGFDFENESTNPTSMIYYRQSVDEFFFTAIYVIIVYMMALSIFKMVDAVPNNIMRWMGVTVSTFQEGAGDPAAQLSQKVYKGSSIMVSQASSMGGAQRSGAQAAIANF